MTLITDLLKGPSVRWLSLRQRLAPLGVPLLWALAALGWVLLAVLPVETVSQGLLALGSLVIMMLLRRPARMRPLQRLAFLALAGLLVARYIVWRATETLVITDPAATVAMFALFFAELYGVAIFFLTIIVNVMPLKRVLPPLPADQARWPTVDVLIPTYDEDAALLETTLLAAQNMRYAEGRCRIYLLDDGGTDQKCNDPDPIKATAARLRREELQALCARIGVHYRTRARNEHAKAGNLNAALQHIDGELVVVLDADHVPTVDFLERIVGAFLADERLSLVQTPHFFVNADPVEHNLRIFQKMPPENELFFGAIQPALDFWEAPLFCGSAVMIRRAALDEVGGFVGQTITEDVETAAELYARGWRGAYYGRPLISGRQPETYSGLITQRVRWAQGMLQLILLNNPLLRPGMKPWQKLCYLNSAAYWAFPFARVVFLLIPSAWLVFGLKVYHASLDQFVAYTLPSIAAMIITGRMLFGRVRWSFVSELYEMLMSYYVLLGLVKVLPNPRAPRFRVTPKGEVRDHDFISSLTKPFYFFFFLAWVSLGFGLWRWFDQPLTREMTLINMVLVLFNLILLHGVLGAMYERRQCRAAPRVPANEPARLVGTLGVPLDAQILDVSASGLQLGYDPARSLPQGRLHIEVTPAALGREVRLPVSIAWQRTGMVGLRFEPGSLAQKREIVALAYGNSQRWRDMQERVRAEADRIGVANAFLRLVMFGSRATLDHFFALLARLSGGFDHAMKRLIGQPSLLMRRSSQPTVGCDSPVQESSRSPMSA